MPLVNYDRILAYDANPMCAQDQDVCAQAMLWNTPAIISISSIGTKLYMCASIVRLHLAVMVLYIYKRP